MSFRMFLNFRKTLLKLHRFSKWPPKQALKEDLQCTSKYGQLRISLDNCHVRMTYIEGFLTIYGHSDNLLNNKTSYAAGRTSTSFGQFSYLCPKKLRLVLSNQKEPRTRAEK